MFIRRLDEEGLPDTMKGVAKAKSLTAGHLSAAVFWGSVWGLWEATAGYVFHSFRVPGIAGLVMFPAGFYLMSRAFATSGRPAVIFLTACTAAMVKLADLFLPGADVFSIINPAQAILLESLAVMGIFSFLKKTERVSLSASVLASVSWRPAYALLGLLAARFFPVRNLFEAGGPALAGFLLRDGVLDGFLIYLLWNIQKIRPGSDRSKIRPVPVVYSCLALAAALLIELVI